MLDRLPFLLAILAAACGTSGCRGSGDKSCLGANDAGASDIGTAAEARPCRPDDYYLFAVSGHMSVDRSITFRGVVIAPGWLAGGEDREIIGRLLAEDGTVLGEHGYMDFMSCAGAHCPPVPHELDFEVAIQMVAGAAFYELIDTVSGNPPVRLDLRGHVQLFCMNEPCELDVCKPLVLDGGSADVSDRDSGATSGDGSDVGPDGGSADSSGAS
jgi:hypothetical protein